MSGAVAKTSAGRASVRGRSHRPARMVVLAGLAVLVSCRASFDKHEVGRGFPPRPQASVAVAVWVEDEANAQSVLAAARENPTIDRAELVDLEADPRRGTCRGAFCLSDMDAHCERLAQAGHDYLLIPTRRTRYDSDYTCTKREFKLEPPYDECVEGHTVRERTNASYELDVIAVSSCKEVPGDTFDDSVHGEESVSLPRAEELLSRVARQKIREYAIPWQADVIAGGPPAEADASGRVDIAREQQILATFRGDDYLGLSTVSERRGDRIAVRPMSCCFELEEGDVLQRRGPYHLTEASVGLSASKLDIEGAGLALGVAWHLRYYPVAGGLILGLGADLLERGDARVELAALEAGYHWNVTPRIDLSVLVGPGANRGARNGRDTERGYHGAATANLTINPMSWWYVTLQGSYVHGGSMGDLDGDGDDELLQYPVGRLSVGVEIH